MTARADEDDADRLLAEARELHRAAQCERDRVRRMAKRMLALVKSKRLKLEADARQFRAVGLEFQTSSAQMQQRFRESWEELQAERRRALEERAASEAYLRKQHEALAACEADLLRRQKRTADQQTRLDAAITDRMNELEALDTRILNAHAALREAQENREALGAAGVPEAEAVPDSDIPTESPLQGKSESDLQAWAALLDRREQQLRRDRIELKAHQQKVARAESVAADERRVLAEQFGKLSLARDRWQDAERRTIEDLEDLAHVLRRRERVIEDRERELMQTDRRRRQENYDLWQRRLQLDGWRGVLTAHEAWWQTERGRQEAEIAEQRARVTRRELAITRLFARWSEKLKSERDRLREEAESWSLSRARLDAAVRACDRQQRDALAMLGSYAAKSLALDETFRQTLDLNESSGPARQFKALQKRWAKVFDRKLDDIDTRLEETRKERRTLNEEHRNLHHRTADVAERTAAMLKRAGEIDLARHQSLPDPYARPAPITNTAELTSLRDEVERLAFVLMNAEWPREAETFTPAERTHETVSHGFRSQAA